MDQGRSLKEAIKIVIEMKLLGTWKLAFMSLASPDTLYFTKNAGDMILGKTNDYCFVTTEDGLY